MFLLFYILYIKILLLYSYEYIDISPYEHKSVQFSKETPYNIFKYSLESLNNIENYYLSVRSTENTDNQKYYLYLYKNEKDITEKDGRFSNYDKNGTATNSYTFKDCNAKVYYMVIRYYNSDEIKDTFYFYSTDIPYEIKNVFYQDYILDDQIRKSYIFSFSNYDKYVQFGLTLFEGTYGKSLTTITNKDTNKVELSKTECTFAESFKLSKYYNYYLNFSLIYSFHSMAYLYIIRSNYSTLIEVEKNKDDFEILPVINEIKIILDVSSMENGHKIAFEYDYNWFDQIFKAEGFTTDNLDDIDKFYEKNKNLDYKTLNVEKEDCKIGDVCKGYIQKDSTDLKKIVLKITEEEEQLRYIKFRYGEEKFAFSRNYLFPLALGLILALPNILFQIIRKLSNKMTASINTIFMNILLNFTYANLIGYYLIKFGDEKNFLIGIILGSIYAALCLFNLCFQAGGYHTYFDVIFNLCNKLDNSIPLSQMISNNRKLYPSIRVGCVAKHEESREVWEEYEEYQVEVTRTETETDDEGNTTSREVFDHYETRSRLMKTHYSNWGRVDRGGGHFVNEPHLRYNYFEKRTEHRTVETWRKEEDYRYKSWQDDTKNIENVKYCSIITATFSYHISFDQASQNKIKQMKDRLYATGKTYDTDVSTYDMFTVPGFVEKHTCPLNEANYQKIQHKFGGGCGYFTWFLLFFLGYSSIFEAYSRYEYGTVRINICKYVSAEENMRMPYATKEVDLPAITISCVHTKLQQKSLDKKLKQGLIDQKEIDIPLIVCNN